MARRPHKSDSIGRNPQTCNPSDAKRNRRFICGRKRERYPPLGLLMLDFLMLDFLMPRVPAHVIPLQGEIARCDTEVGYRARNGVASRPAP